MEKRALVCEFVGARGVGKSTMAELVMSEVRRRQFRCNRLRPFGLSDKLAVELGGHLNLLRAFHTIRQLRPVSRQQLYKLSRRYCGVLQGEGRRFERDCDIILLPVGVFQMIYMLHMHTAQKDMLALSRTLLRQVSPPDLVVLIEAPEQAIEHRRKLRGEARDLRNPPQVTAIENEALSGLKETLKRLAKEPAAGLEYLAVINEARDSMAATAIRIADTIAQKQRARLHLSEMTAALV